LPFRRRPGVPVRRLRLVAVAAALGALALPSIAEAHSSSPVIAVDYEARPARSVIADGVTVRVLDGNRKLELTVRAPHRVVVVGYGREAFLRFDPAGVWVNERSLTAVANKLTEPGATPALDGAAPPRWQSLTSSHTYAWHDHRLALVPGSMATIGRVGTWAVPVLVDGRPLRVEGGLWHDPGPLLWPWLVLLGAVAAAVGVALAVHGGERLRRAVVYAGAAVAGVSFLIATSGFALARATSGTWVSVALPIVLAVVAIAVFVVRPELRYAIAAAVGLIVVAESLSQSSVFLHGYVISDLPAAVARAAVAAALLSGLTASLAALTGLFRERPRQPARTPAKPPPTLAIPKGRRR